MNKKEFVTIQSTVDIRVTPGLQYEDVTNPDAHVADRLKVNATWPQMTVLITKGVGTYPAYIAEWNTVKALVKDKILTIANYVDEAANEKDVEVKEKLDRNIADVKARMNQLRKVEVKEEVKTSLSDLAGE